MLVIMVVNTLYAPADHDTVRVLFRSVLETRRKGIEASRRGKKPKTGATPRTGGLGLRVRTSRVLDQNMDLKKFVATPSKRTAAMLYGLPRVTLQAPLLPHAHIAVLSLWLADTAPQ